MLRVRYMTSPDVRELLTRADWGGPTTTAEAATATARIGQNALPQRGC